VCTFTVCDINSNAFIHCIQDRTLTSSVMIDYSYVSFVVVVACAGGIVMLFAACRDCTTWSKKQLTGSSDAVQGRRTSSTRQRLVTRQGEASNSASLQSSYNLNTLRMRSIVVIFKLLRVPLLHFLARHFNNSILGLHFGHNLYCVFWPCILRQQCLCVGLQSAV